MSASASSVPLPPRTQDPCCYTSAVDREATYCEVCGKPLLRCMAVEECGGLLDDQGLCTICVAPYLEISAGATIEAKVGSAIALPVSITNVSAIGRPLFVTKVLSREAGNDWCEIELGWERLDAGQTRPMVITASKLEHSGAHNLEILVVVSSRWRWRKERYAFSTALRLQVDDNTSKTGPVITIGGESAGHGNTVYIAGDADKQDRPAKTTEAVALDLVRAEKEERKLGLRGLSPDLWIPKNAKLNWRGFSNTDVALDAPILTIDGILAVGRTRSRRSGGLGDVRLLVEDGDGGIDEELSRRISRRHFELYIECNRLILRVTGTAGVRVNGEAFGPGKEVALANDDHIEPLVAAPDALALHIGYRIEHGAIREVTITRKPSSHIGD